MSQAAFPETRREEMSLEEQEITSSIVWLIGIRWIAGVGVLVAAWLAAEILRVHVPSAPLYAVGIVILLYNAVFEISRRRVLKTEADPVRTFTAMTKWQIGIDYVVMVILIHFTGGLESPAVLYYFFHIIIAAILFSPRTTYLYTTLAVALYSGTAGLQYVGILPHVHIPEFVGSELFRNPIYILGKLFFFISTAYAAAYLASTLNIRLRKRAAQVVALSHDLQGALSRLETLYQNAQAANSTLELPQVLDRLVKGTVEAMGVRACSIRLLDDSGSRLLLAASHGLSPQYVQKGDVVLEHNPLARRVLMGTLAVITNDLTFESSLQYPSAALAEGIHSMLSAPLRGKGQPLGLIRAYSVERNHFTQADATFFSAIASQGSIAIENALAYQALNKLEQTKSKFVLIVTHELRSPVSVIRSLLRTMMAGYTGSLSDEQKDIVTRALRRTDFLQTLIDDLLDLAAGKSDLGLAESRVEVRLDQAVERVLKQFEVPAQEKQIRIEWNCASTDHPLAVSATNEGMDRILGNLVSNAIKYTPPGGCITISLGRVDGNVELAIADTGIGVSPEALTHLFEEFYRAPNAKALEKEGTGLGLAITHDLVTRYGGRISVHSELGRGTVFSLLFPIVRDSQNPAGRIEY